MLRGLRLRLTGLYLLAAGALIALVGVGTYQLVDRYFQTVTDLDLQHKMAQEFRGRGVPLPPQLAAADQTWTTGRTSLFPAGAAAGATALATPDPRPSGETDERAGGEIPLPGAESDEEIYDGELAAIFVLPVDSAGGLKAATAPSPPLVPDRAAIAAAAAQGADWRTVALSNGTRVRLLTYRLPDTAGVAAIQVGRTLADQDRVLHQLLISLLALGAVSAVLLGGGSWVLAGRALRPAQAAWAHQQTFVANASHELRTPLTLLRVSAEVAQRSLPAGSGPAAALLDDVLHEADHLGRLVEDLLLLSRLDAGRLPLAGQAVPLAPLLAEVSRQFGRLTAERQVQLEVTGAAGTAWGDPTRLRQVLLILLDNALRNTPAGGRIHLDAQPQGRDVAITVGDTGCGIAPEHIPHLFERFYRAGATPAADGGTGLGLAIAKGLLDAQHGAIAVASRPGAGTQVTVRLPAAPTTPD